jgi:hypothetical protein
VKLVSKKFLHSMLFVNPSKENGSIIIPVWWLEDSEGKMWADAWQIEYDDMHKVDCHTLPLQLLTD